MCAQKVDVWYRPGVRGSAAVVAVALLMAVRPTSAVAAEPEQAQTAPDAPAGTDSARTHFEAGREAFAEKRYADAAKSFEAAANISPHPASFINAGEAWEKAGDAVHAIRAYERVRMLEQASEQDRNDAVSRIEQLRNEVGTIKLVGSSKTRVLIGQESWHGGDRVFVEPGKYLVRLPDIDDAKAKRVEVAAGGVKSVRIESLLPSDDEPSSEPTTAPVETPKPPTPEAGGGVSFTTGLLLGTAVVATGAAVYFTIQVVDSRNAFDEHPSRQEYDRFQQKKLLTNVNIGIAIIAASVGTVLLVGDLDTDDEAKPKPAALLRPKRVGLGITPYAGGAGLTALANF
jgi:hypothetical protein